MIALQSVLSLAGLFLLALLWWPPARIARFRADERNPYRRYCVHCGQQQDLYEQGYSTYWVAIGFIRSEVCSCHEATKDTP